MGDATWWELTKRPMARCVVRRGDSVSQKDDTGLDINNLGGQGYDNRANMRGKNNSLQKRLLDLNPRAFYVPCASHSLNLIINDAANLNHHTTGFFSIVQDFI